MKKIAILLVTLFAASLLSVAQVKLYVHKTDGTKVGFNVSEVDYIDLAEDTDPKNYIYYSNPEDNITDFDNINIDELISNSNITTITNENGYIIMKFNMNNYPSCEQVIGIVEGEYSDIDLVNIDGVSFIGDIISKVRIIKEYYGVKYTVAIFTSIGKYGKYTNGNIKFIK